MKETKSPNEILHERMEFENQKPEFKKQKTMNNNSFTLRASVKIAIVVCGFLACGCHIGSSKKDKETNDSLLAAQYQEKLANASDANFNLSNQFFFDLTSYRLNPEQGSHSLEGTSLIAYLKADSSYWRSFESTWELPKNYQWTSRSYSTGYHTKDKAADGNYGDVVIQDFNFDGREDIALKLDRSNAGTRYFFFLQNENGSFSKDSFLSDTISFFPTLDPKTKTVSVANLVGASMIHEQKYAFSENGWSMVVDTIIENQ